MVYKVIGLMSGSSLDGLDMVYTHLNEVRGGWSFQIVHAACLPYTDEWVAQLRHAKNLSVADFLKLHTAYGHYIGERVNEFITTHNIQHQVHFIASHGHTVFHEPASKTTFQIGDGAAIAARVVIPVISDLRSLDVALNGQGAPIVPVGDKLLFGDYDYLLNIGGIANITIRNGDNMLAFDICPANQILNTLALQLDKPYDDRGNIAASGGLLGDVLEHLNKLHYYTLPAPKSLSNEMVQEMIYPSLLQSSHATADMLYTMTTHIATQVAQAVAQHPTDKENPTLLITGGGAFNTFLVDKIKEAVAPYHITVAVPDGDIIKYKEALVMALIGTLRWREETNVYSSVTGATRDSISGALWMGQVYA